jgi:hypothetical protein
MDLHELPPGVQPDSSTALAQLRARVGAVRRQATALLSEAEAEQIALAQLEADLLSQDEAARRSMQP